MTIAYKHDPRLKDLDELQKTLIIGKKILQEILNDLKPSNKNILTDQSWILTGARGSGKSHILTLLYRTIKNDSYMSKYWFPLSFPEELYSVDSLYRFLLAVIDTGLKELNDGQKIEKLKNSYIQIKNERLTGTIKEKELQKHKYTKDFFEILRKIISASGKKWILLVENLQEVLNKQLSEDDQKHLRGFMHEHSESFIIIGSALTVFDEIENYGKPFYHFFRIRSLEKLTKEGMINFLEKIAEYRNDMRIEKIIRKNRPYLYTFHLLTGGNPRLILFIYELLADYKTLNTELILDKVTELTPYFRDKTTDISQQQKLIIDTLANEAPAQSVTEIAHFINGEVNAVSVQCRRMSHAGWLRPISLQAKDVKKKEIFYTLRDYFYRIWYKLRTGAIDRSDVYCLAELTVLLFGQEELEKKMIQIREKNTAQYAMYQTALKLTQDKKFMKNIQMLYTVAKEEVNAEVSILMNDIETRIEKKQYKKAEQIVLNLLKHHDADHIAYLYLGIIYDLSGNLEKAIENYSKAVEIKPDFHEAWNNMGIAFANQGQYKKAIENYSKAVEIKPDKHEAWYNMGNAFADQGQYKKAIENYLKAVEIKPDFHEAWNNMGNAFADQGQYKKAIENYLKAVEIKPDFHEAWYNMGIAFADQGQYKKAIENYSKAVEIKPDYHEAWYNMGNAFTNQGQHKKAIENYLKAVEIKPDYHEAWYNMGNAFTNQGQHKKAIENYSKAVEIKPDYHEAWYNMGSAFVHMENYQDAWNAYNKFFQYAPYFPPFTYRIFSSLQKIAKSIFSYNKIIVNLDKKRINAKERINSLIKLLLLGKIIKGSEWVEALLKAEKPLPEKDVKKLLFLMDAFLIADMQKKKINDQTRMIMQYNILLRLKVWPKEELKKWFIRFVYNYLILAKKESFNPDALKQLVDHLKKQGIPVSDNILSIIHALQYPDSRKAQVWMADPLFAEIIKMLKK